MENGTSRVLIKRKCEIGMLNTTPCNKVTRRNDYKVGGYPDSTRSF